MENFYRLSTFNSRYAPPTLFLVECLTLFGRMSDEIYCWGWGKDGQLGHGDRNSQKSPVKVEMLSNKPISSISCGGWHSCALTPNGDVYAWGSGRCGQLGLGDWASHRVPVLVPDLCGKGVREIACGSFHTCCLLESGSVFSWGCGRDGQLGHGDYGSPRVPTLLKALEGKVILKIVCGEYHSAALSSSGDVWTWGDGAEGQLGHDDWKEKVCNSFSMILLCFVIACVLANLLLCINV